MYDYGYNVPNGKITMERFYSDALPSKLPSTYLISHSWAYFFTLYTALIYTFEGLSTVNMSCRYRHYFGNPSQHNVLN